MSGGLNRVRLDDVADYLSLRRETIGFELAPLLLSLQLPAAEISPTPNRQIALGIESAAGN